MRGVATADRRARAEEALVTVRLGGYGARLPHQLSGGQQQRVALARAIVYRPPVLLMDEPLSALDAALREEMRLEIKRLQKALGITVVFVTHDQAEALTMADRIAVLDHGRLQQVGTPTELYERPTSAFVAGFIGQASFLEGVAEADAPDGAVLQLGGTALAGTAVGPIRAGAQVRLAVRPERVRPDAAGLAARVAETVYAGAETACLLELPGGATLRMRLGAGEAVPRPDEALAVAWRPEDARVFPA
jgi:putative spermidine/putrescine transport system ATP-binding protein/mannopine transport system ATP-binding protein